MDARLSLCGRRTPPPLPKKYKVQGNTLVNSKIPGKIELRTDNLRPPRLPELHWQRQNVSIATTHRTRE